MKLQVKNIFLLSLLPIMAVLLYGKILLVGRLHFGGDWSLPHSPEASFVYLNNTFFSWGGTYLGNRTFYSNDLYGRVFVHIVSLLSSNSIGTILFLFLFTAPFSMFFLLRKLHLRKDLSIMVSCLYVFTPIFYNYFLMGWVWVLLSMAVFPLVLIFFIDLMQKGRIINVIPIALIVSLAISQSQSIVWMGLILLLSGVFLVTDVKKFKRYLFSLAVVFLISSLLHSFWWPSLLFFRDFGNLEGSYVLTSGSVGTSAKINFLNLQRTWGNLFNYQFEYAFPSLLLPFSFLPAITFLLGFKFFAKNKSSFRIFLYFLCLFFIPVVLYVIPRSFISLIPFSGLIRDFGRFSVLSTFSFVVVFGLLTSKIFNKVALSTTVKQLILVVLVIVFSFPFWNSSLWREQYAIEDFRIRELNLPEFYYKGPEILNNMKGDLKALMLPLGYNTYFLYQHGYSPPYGAVADVWFGYSRKRGVISGAFSPVKDLLQNISAKGDAESLLKLLPFLSTDTIVIKDFASLDFLALRELEEKLIKSPQFDYIYKDYGGSIISFNSPLPHFYLPTSLINTNDVNALIDYYDLYASEEGDFPAFITDKSFGQKQNRFDLPSVIYTKPIKDEISIISLEWHKKWAWPKASVSPESPQYKLVRIKENLSIRREKDSIAKADLLLWLAAKRSVEINTYNLSYNTKQKLYEDINTKINRAKETLSHIDQANRGSTYWGMVKKLYLYTERIIDEVEDTRSLGFSYEDIHSWLISTDAIISGEEKIYGTLDIFESADYSLAVKDPGFIVSEDFPVRIVLWGIGDGIYKESLIQDFDFSETSWIKTGTYPLYSENKYIVNTTPFIGENIIEKEDIIQFDFDDFSNEGMEMNFSTPLSEDIQLNFTGLKKNQDYLLSFEYVLSDNNLEVNILTETPDLEKIYTDPHYDWKNFSVEDVPYVERVVHFEEIRCDRVGSDCDWDDGNYCYEDFSRVFTLENNDSGLWISLYADNKESDGPGTYIRNLELRPYKEPDIAFLNETDRKPRFLSKNSPSITYKKINQTKYKIFIEGVEEITPLVFNESFNEGWRVYLTSENESLGGWRSFLEGKIKEGYHSTSFFDRNPFETMGMKEISSDDHFMVNGYANAWLIDPEELDGKENVIIIVEFLPQRWSYVGMIIASATLVGCFTVLGVYGFRKLIWKLKKQ